MSSELTIEVRKSPYKLIIFGADGEKLLEEAEGGMRYTGEERSETFILPADEHTIKVNKGRMDYYVIYGSFIGRVWNAFSIATQILQVKPNTTQIHVRLENQPVGSQQHRTDNHQSGSPLPRSQGLPATPMTVSVIQRSELVVAIETTPL